MARLGISERQIQACPGVCLQFFTLDVCEVFASFTQQVFVDNIPHARHSTRGSSTSGTGLSAFEEVSYLLGRTQATHNETIQCSLRIWDCADPYCCVDGLCAFQNLSHLTTPPLRVYGNMCGYGHVKIYLCFRDKFKKKS